MKNLFKVIGVTLVSAVVTTSSALSAITAPTFTSAESVIESTGMGLIDVAVIVFTVSAIYFFINRKG